MMKLKEIENFATRHLSSIIVVIIVLSSVFIWMLGGKTGQIDHLKPE